MVYWPSKEYLFNKILWAGFSPVLLTILVGREWNPAGISHNIFWLAGLSLIWGMFSYLVFVFLTVYRAKLYLDEEGIGVLRSDQEMKIKWEEIKTIGVWQNYGFIVPQPTMVVSSARKEFFFRLSLLSPADYQSLKKELIAQVGRQRIYPAFD